MEPVIKEGSKVLVSSVPYFFIEPKLNDIVLFQKNGKKFIKRIKKKKFNNFFLLGDNKKDSMDSKSLGWITREDIIGKIIFKL